MTATIPSEFEAFFGANATRIRNELVEFLRIPSVSARSEHDADTARAAAWLAAECTRIGLTTEVIPTPGHPVVLAEWRGAPAGAPTVLVYGHYDVQPAEPLELWTSPPFEPTERDGKLFARGAVDDKGQLYLHVKALEAHLAVRANRLLQSRICPVSLRPAHRNRPMTVPASNQLRISKTNKVYKRRWTWVGFVRLGYASLFSQSLCATPDSL